MSDSEFLTKRNEYCRQMLQQIKDAPANETEEAFREHHLVGMSDPKLWGENLPAMVGYAFQMFEAGWKAKEAAQPAEEVQPVGEVMYCEGITYAELREPITVKPGDKLYTRPPAAEADRLDAERYRWLRNPMSGSTRHDPKVYKDGPQEDVEWAYGEELDTIVDEAMARDFAQRAKWEKKAMSPTTTIAALAASKEKKE